MSRTPHRDLPLSLQRLSWLTFFTSIAAMVFVLLAEGYEIIKAPWFQSFATAIWLSAVAVSVLNEWLVARRAIRPIEALQAQAVDVVLLGVIVLLALWGGHSQLGLAVFVRQAIVATRVFISTRRGQRLLLTLLGQPAKLLTGSFAAIIVVGALFLTFPRSTTDDAGASPIDALFTATSATCVTGLTVLNTNDDGRGQAGYQAFSTFGQVVIFILIQVGGLGIMTLSSSLLLFMGRRLGLRGQALMQNVMEEESRRDLERSLRFVVKSTFLIEAVGATLLFWRFLPILGDGSQAFYYAVFHSVSAYCNAGFSLFGDNLTSLRSDGVVMVTVMGLITMGGLGAPVVAALAQREHLHRSPWVSWARLPAHVRMVLLISLGLVLTGAVVFYYCDFFASLDGLSRGDKVLSAFFQSVTMRTAGFNTVDLGLMHRVTLVACVLLMLVGGSPGGTAGGVKTSTMAVVFLSVRAMLLGRDEVELGGRTIPRTIVYKAVSILLIYLGTLTAAFLCLLVTEPEKSFESLLFECCSAIGTVGVSMSVTPKLSIVGKIIITGLMFVGRTGPLTLALAVGERTERIAVHYPEGKFMVG